MTQAHNAPITDVRNAVLTIITAEFGSEGFKILPGRLGPYFPSAAFGVFPRQEAAGRLVLDQDSAVTVQCFTAWPKTADPARVVDPTAVESLAERLREAVYRQTHPYIGSSGVWVFTVSRVDYTEDPTGQITRFEATVIAQGQNFAETV